MYDLSQERVLAVDDEPDNLYVLKATLELLQGSTVQVAMSFEEALSCLVAFKPTAIVTDLSMPKADGYVLLHSLRQRPDTARLPIIALTAHAMTGDRERILAAGFDGYISKPFDVVTLADELGALLDEFRKRQPSQEPVVPQAVPPTEIPASSTVNGEHHAA